VATIGPWTGTFSWRPVEDQVGVPAWAREASLMIGMGGGTGVLEVDDVEVEPVAR
jgi:hypothetical protein